MARRKKRQPFVDDGRTIADMSFDQHHSTAPNGFGVPFRLPYGAARVQREAREAREMARLQAARAEAEGQEGEGPDPMIEAMRARRMAAQHVPTRRETGSIIANAMLAGLLVALVYLAVFAVFFLFVFYVWLR